MSIRSKRDSKDYNGNEVYVQIGQYKVFQNLISLTVWDDEGNEYSIKSLLEKILDQEKEIHTLQSELERLTTNTKNAIKAYQSSNDNSLSLTVKTVELMSKQITNLSKDLEEIQKKVKFL